MPNITNILNEQIRRLSRREISSGTKLLRRAGAQHRRDIAALKRQVAALTKVVAFLERQEKRRVAEQPVPTKEVEGVRFRADGLKSHRAKLGLSADDYGKLVGVSGQTIYNWEAAKARPRKEQVGRVAAVRGLGKREATKRLEMLAGVADGGRRRRGAYKQTAEEFIRSLVKSKKATTTAEINAAWKASGRGGRANNTLSTMVGAKKLKRVKLQGERGSRYV